MMYICIDLGIFYFSIELSYVYIHERFSNKFVSVRISNLGIHMKSQESIYEIPYGNRYGDPYGKI